MLVTLEVLILIAVLWACAFYRAPYKVWVPVITALLLVYSFVSCITWWLLLIFWVLLAVGVFFTVIPQTRKMLVSKPMLKVFRHLLPPISDTEREALEAGDVWFEGELFSGAPDWQKLFKLDKPTLTAEERDFIDNQTETLCAMIDDWDIVQKGDMPKKVWSYLKKEGFFGLIIGKEYGGHGFSALAHSAVVTKIASRSASVAVNTMVPNSLGPAELIHHYGTPEQKKYYLPRLAIGEEIPCFGLTSPTAGSDAGSITDSGVLCKGEYEGKKVLGIRLNFEKHYITLAPVATVMGVAVKLYDPDHLLGEKDELGITLCLLPTKTPGVEHGTRHCPLSLAFMNGPIRGKDVFVPLDAVIGGQEQIGKGWYMMMEALSVGRGISLPSLSTATAKQSFRMTGAWALLRKQFRTPIGRFEGVQEGMARIGGFTYLCESARILSASAVDLGVKPSLVSAITKYHNTEFGRKAISDAMDIHGGRGIQMGPRNYLGNLYIGAPVGITVEGANILTRNLIIFGQGAVRCHPYTLKEMAAADLDNPRQALQQFDKLLFAHFGYAIRNAVRSFSYGLVGAKCIRVPHKGVSRKYLKQLTRMSSALAFVSDMAMITLGGKLKRKERLSARLGDVLSHLYYASAVLKYFQDQNFPASDVPFVRWSVDYCLHQIQLAFDEFFANFPKRGLAVMMRCMIFPWGRAYKMPKDSLGERIAVEMMKPSALRQRLCDLCYVTEDESDGTGLIEKTFQLHAKSEAANIKLLNAVRSGRVPREGSMDERLAAATKAGILTAEESKMLAELQILKANIVRVDEFVVKAGKWTK